MNYDDIVRIYLLGMAVWGAYEVIGWIAEFFMARHVRTCSVCGDVHEYQARWVRRGVPWAVLHSVLVTALWPADLLWGLVILPRDVMRSIRKWRAAQVIAKTESMMAENGREQSIKEWMNERDIGDRGTADRE